MKENKRKHLFVIPAYEENPYLEACISSLLSQSGDGKIVIATSTPNSHIRTAAEKFGIEMIVNPNTRGIASDWNFCLSLYPEYQYITLAHQDDIYFNNYSAMVSKKLNEHPDALICFTNFAEIRGQVISHARPYILIKSMMLLPFFVKSVISSKFLKKLTLIFGNPVSCSSVTFNRSTLPQFSFSSSYSVNLDWEAWLRMSQMPGSFCFIRRPLIAHRLSPENETAKSILDNRRFKEDLELFTSIWPGWIARFLLFFYKNSYKKEIH